jgi:hypothetical protein
MKTRQLFEDFYKTALICTRNPLISDRKTYNQRRSGKSSDVVTVEAIEALYR